MQTYRLVEGIYEARRSDGLMCHDLRTKFHTDWFKHSEVSKGSNRPTDTHRQHGYSINLLSFFHKKEIMLKTLQI
jgi:hypothetical protein